MEVSHPIFYSQLQIRKDRVWGLGTDHDLATPRSEVLATERGATEAEEARVHWEPSVFNSFQ